MFKYGSSYFKKLIVFKSPESREFFMRAYLVIKEYASGYGTFSIKFIHTTVVLYQIWHISVQSNALIPLSHALNYIIL